MQIETLPIITNLYDNSAEAQRFGFMTNKKRFLHLPQIWERVEIMSLAYLAKTIRSIIGEK